jgi:hypothetical protein
MQSDLVFPAPRVADPPPPLDKLLIDLLNNEEFSEVILTNPLTAQNIPETEEARVALHSLARIRQALSTPFNTPDRCFGREDWLKLVLELIANIHGGIRNCQLAAPEGEGKIADAFFDLTTTEEAITSRTRELIGDLAGFYWTDGDDSEHIVKHHCFRCVQTAAIDLKDNANLLTSIQLNTALDTRKVRETLLNEAVRAIHKEVDEWREEQRGSLIAYITDLITADTLISAENLSDAAHSLSPAFRDWVKKYGDIMRLYVRRSISEVVNEDLIDPYGRELLDEALACRRKTVEAEADAEFDGPAIKAQRVAAISAQIENDLTHTRANMVADGEALLVVERAAIAAAATIELNKFREGTRIKTAEEKARLEEVAITAVRRSSRIAAMKPTPLASNNNKKPKLGKRKANAFDLNPPSPIPNADSDSEYAPSEASEASHTADESPEVLTAPSPFAAEPRAPTPSWLTTPEPPTKDETRPTSTTPKPTATLAPPPPPTTTDPVLAAILAAVTNTNSTVAALSDRVARLEQPSTTNGSYNDQVLTAADYADKGAYDNYDPVDAEMYDPAADDKTEDEAKQHLHDQVEQETYFDELYIMLRDRGLANVPVDETFAESFYHVVGPAFVTFGLSRFLPLTDEQMTSLGHVWNRFVDKHGKEALLNGARETYMRFTNSRFARGPDFDNYTTKFNAFCAEFNYNPATGFPEDADRFFTAYKVGTTQQGTKARTPPTPPPMHDITALPFADGGWTTVKPVSYSTAARNKKEGEGKSPPPSSPPVAGTLVPVLTAKPQQKRQPRPLPAALLTTEYVVLIDHDFLFPPTSTRPADVSVLVRRAQDALSRVRADIRLLAGRWSSPGTGRKNFVFTFEGKLDVSKISKYDEIIFAGLGPNCRGVPNAGFTSVMFNGVPCFRDTLGNLPSSAALEAELSRSPVTRGRRTLAPPRWLGGPSHLDGKLHGSVVWSFYDPIGDAVELMTRRPPAFFGTYVRARKFSSRPTLIQCEHCHRLGHTAARCQRLKVANICVLCGGPHTTASHHFHCPAPKHKGKKCDCPTSCFLCREKKRTNFEGHHARSQSCPLRSQYRADTTRPPPAPPAEANNVAPPLPEASPSTLLTPTPPSPAALAARVDATPVID